MRHLLVAFAAALSFTAPVSASAQSEPRDLTIVAPAAPGGGWDQTARVMQQVLRATGLARSVQVVNAPGAAGTIGLARFVISEAGNGEALLVTGLVMVSGIAANRSPVTLADVTPIARLSGEYEVIVVPASSPYRSLAGLVAAFQANPRAVSWGGGRDRRDSGLPPRAAGGRGTRARELHRLSGRRAGARVRARRARERGGQRAE